MGEPKRVFGPRYPGRRDDKLYRELHLHCRHRRGQWHWHLDPCSHRDPLGWLAQNTPERGCAHSVKAACGSLARSSHHSPALGTHTFLHSGTFLSRVLDSSVQRCEYTGISTALVQDWSPRVLITNQQIQKNQPHSSDPTKWHQHQHVSSASGQTRSRLRHGPQHLRPFISAIEKTTTKR